MGLRTVLYGYRVENLGFAIESEEAEIVRKIFGEYISGMTLKEIADCLTTDKIVYYKDKCTWTKNAVYRIVGNEHYTGDYEYPAIISKKVFLKANSVKSQKGCKKTSDLPEIIFLKRKTICDQCGHHLTRRRNYSGTRECWECLNYCKIECFLDDNTYFEKIRSILNFVIENTGVLRYENFNSEQYEPTLEIIRQEREIDRMLEQKEAKFLLIKGAAFNSASARFECCKLDYTKSITKKLIEFLQQQTYMAELDFALLQKIVKRITVNQFGRIEITFLNNKTIREQEVTSNGNGSDNAESCYEDCGESIVGCKEQLEQTA